MSSMSSVSLDIYLYQTLYRAINSLLVSSLRRTCR